MAILILIIEKLFVHRPYPPQTKDPK